MLALSHREAARVDHAPCARFPRWPLRLCAVADYVRWQYRIVGIGTDAARNLGITLSYFGQRGWELQTVFDKSSFWWEGIETGFVLFKRPVPVGAEPEGPWAEVWSAERVALHYEQQHD